MIQRRKKKVSFDVDVIELQKVQDFCAANDFKISDFFRAAMAHFYEFKKNNYDIWVLDDFQIKHFSIPRNQFDLIDVALVDSDTQIMTNFKKIVQVVLKPGENYVNVKDGRLRDMLIQGKEVKAYIEDL